MNRKVHWLLVLVLIGLAPGCGINSDQAIPLTAQATGRAVLTILWPSRSRLIPVASSLIRVEITGPDGITQYTQDANRPISGNSTTLEFTNLPVGDLPLTATAYPDNPVTAASVPQAQGTQHVTLQAKIATPVTVVMNSTIHHLDVAPGAPSVPNGQTLNVTMTARDSVGNMVLISPANVHWVSANTAVATVVENSNGSGTVMGRSGGTTQLTVTETESGKSATVPLTVFNGGVHFDVQ